MPTTIRRSTPLAPLTASAPRRVKVKVSENDPALKAEVRAGGTLVVLKGVANNRGTVASALTLEFAGNRITLHPRRGDTAQALREQLRLVMPEGYRLAVPAYLGRTGKDLASFEIHADRPLR